MKIWSIIRMIFIYIDFKITFFICKFCKAIERVDIIRRIQDLTFCKLKLYSRLLFEFWPTRENRLKSSRLRFGSFIRKDALKSEEFRNNLSYKKLTQPFNLQSSFFNLQ